MIEHGGCAPEKDRYRKSCVMTRDVKCDMEECEG